MTEIPKRKAYGMIGDKVIYEVSRWGARNTYYFYDNLNDAVKKYDEVCMRRNYYTVNLYKYPVKGKYYRENVYTTSTNTVNVEHRNVAKFKMRK